MKLGRKKKQDVKRDRTTGRSRGEDGIHPESLARRERELREAGIVLQFEKIENNRVTVKRTATDALSGTTVGKLLLRWRQSPGRPDGISQDQFDTAEEWLKLCHRHAAIMGYKLNISAMTMETGGGLSTAADPDPEYIARTRRRWTACHDALGREGARVYTVTSGVVLQEWPLDRMTQSEIGELRTGLNAIRRALDS